VNLYIGGAGKAEVAGHKITIKQQTDYPWDGAVKLTVTPEKPAAIALRLRVPGWLGAPLPGDLYRYLPRKPLLPHCRINGQPVEPALEHGYWVLNRTWKPGDVVELNFPMQVHRVLCNEKVEDNIGRIAIERGPIVYCVEGADHDGKVLDLFLEDNVELTPEPRPDLLGGVTVLTGSARRACRADDNTSASRSARITMIPYYSWCNRGANEMAVWLPRGSDKAQVPPLPTIATAARATASHNNDQAGAANDGVEPKNSIDHDIPRFTWWDHKGGSEWIQLDLARPTRVSATDIYWFDDTGRGQCRVPASWKLLYRDGSDWKPVTTDSAYATGKDAFNTVGFTPVTTDALRIEVRLQEDFSGGVLEWKVR
jgi:hypothetical protein